MTATSDPRIREADGWFYVYPGNQGSYRDHDGDDLGTGAAQSITRFRSEETAIYYLRSEDYRRHLNRALNKNLENASEISDLTLKLQAIPRWIRALFAKPEPPEQYPDG